MSARLGRYVMLKHLASGGMADVMLGRSDGIEGFERHVVLKRIRPEHARDQRFIRMFLDEARLAAALHHQHIVQVHDIGESDGEYFLAMEYVHGEDVRKILTAAARQRAHVPLGYAVAIVSAAAAGLHYAHEQCGSDKQPLHIVHRDVSPSNILVGYDGAIKVVDFGIATASLRQETRTGGLTGKLSYMAPEQCKGMPVDRRSDVYSLGVVLYELATTSRMVKAETDYLAMEQIVNGRFVPPRDRRPDLPAELSSIILRALATERDERYASADELRIALDRFASAAGLTASSSTIAAYMRQQFGHRPEPWLDLERTDAGSLDDRVGANDGSLASGSRSRSWSEPPRTGSGRSRHSSSMLSGPMSRIVTDVAPVAPVAPRRDDLPPSRVAPPASPAASGPMPGPAPRPRGTRSPVGRVAAITGVPILGLMGWLALGRGAGDAPPTTSPLPLSAAPPASANHPGTAELPNMVEVIATGSEAVAVARAEPAAPRKPGAAASTSPPAARPAAAAPPSPPPAARIGIDRGDRVARVVAVPPPEPVARSPEPRPAGDDPRRTVIPSPIAPTVAAPTAPLVASPPIIPAPAAPIVPTAPLVVAPAVLDANRIAGDKRITPDESTMDAIGRAGKDALISSYKLCIAADGSVEAATQLRSTGFPSYDAKIVATIRRDWRFRPYLVNGKPTPVCTALRFVYSQK